MIRAVVIASLAVGASGAALAADTGVKQSEIVITATPLAGPFATVADSVSRDDILKQGGANLADSLADVPGVSGTGFAAGASRPVIRGMDANRVKILEDGVGTGDVSDIGPDHGVPVDPLSARRIEVVRGAGTLRYGSQAIGGVVNAINDRVPTALPSAPLSGELSATYGSAADTREGAALFDGRIGQVAFHADGFARTTGDYDTPLGTQTNSFFKGDGYALGSSYIFPNASHIGAAYVRYDSKYGIPSDTTFIDMRQNKGLLSGAFNIAGNGVQKVSVDLSYADYKHAEIDPDTNETLSTFKNREWDGRTELLLGSWGPFKSSALGFQVQNRAFSALGEGGDYLSPTRSRSGAAFLFTEAPLGEHADLQGAVRVESADIDGTPASLTPTSLRFTPISGSLGAVFEPSSAWRFGLTATSAARAPAVTELFARGPHDGPGTFETGDPDLKLERANSLEATLTFHPGKLKLAAALWGARFQNYIYGDLTGALCDDAGDCASPPGADLKQLVYIQRDATFWGAEAKADYDIAELGAGTVKLNALADLTRAQFSNGGGFVPRIQPWRAGGGLSWDSPAFDIGFLYLHVGQQDRVPVGDTTTDGYEELNAQLAWRPLANRRALELALVGHNLTDDVHRNAVALNRDDVVAPGRDVRLVLRTAF